MQNERQMTSTEIKTAPIVSSTWCKQVLQDTQDAINASINNQLYSDLCFRDGELDLLFPPHPPPPPEVVLQASSTSLGTGTACTTA